MKWRPHRQRIESLQFYNWLVLPRIPNSSFSSRTPITEKCNIVSLLSLTNLSQGRKGMAFSSCYYVKWGIFLLEIRVCRWLLWKEWRLSVKKSRMAPYAAFSYLSLIMPFFPVTRQFLIKRAQVHWLGQKLRGKEGPCSSEGKRMA